MKPCRTVEKCKCLWLDCEGVNVSEKTLLSHLLGCHIEAQVKRLQLSNDESSRKYVCLWTGCRYFEHESTREWLEGHVLKHTGDKPFPCIYPNCEWRFPTRPQLERHVRDHMDWEGHVPRSRPAIKQARNSKKQKACVRTHRPGWFQIAPKP